MPVVFRRTRCQLLHAHPLDGQFNFRLQAPQTIFECERVKDKPEQVQLVEHPKASGSSAEVTGYKIQDSESSKQKMEARIWRKRTKARKRAVIMYLSSFILMNLAAANASSSTNTVNTSSSEANRSKLDLSPLLERDSQLSAVTDASGALTSTRNPATTETAPLLNSTEESKAKLMLASGTLEAESVRSIQLESDKISAQLAGARDKSREHPRGAQREVKDVIGTSEPQAAHQLNEPASFARLAEKSPSLGGNNSTRKATRIKEFTPADDVNQKFIKTTIELDDSSTESPAAAVLSGVGQTALREKQPQLGKEMFHEQENEADKLQSQRASSSRWHSFAPNQAGLGRALGRATLEEAEEKDKGACGQDEPSADRKEKVRVLVVGQPQFVSSVNELSYQSSLKPSHVEPPQVAPTPRDPSPDSSPGAASPSSAPGLADGVFPSAGPPIYFKQVQLLQAEPRPAKPAGGASTSRAPFLRAKGLSFLPQLATRLFSHHSAPSPATGGLATSGLASALGERQQEPLQKLHSNPASVYKAPTRAARLIPKSLRSLLEPLNVNARFRPLGSARRAKQLASADGSPTVASEPALPLVNLVMLNGQLYSIVSPQLSGAAMSPVAPPKASVSHFDYQTSDTSEFPVFEAMSASSQRTRQASGCSSPRHVIHADRSVVSHILESQQNFVIARVPTKRYPQPSYSMEEQVAPAQSHVYHAFPLQALATASSPVDSAFPSSLPIQYQPAASTAAFELHTTTARPSLWQSFSNFINTLKYGRRPFGSETSGSTAVYSVDVPYYFGGRRFRRRRGRRLEEPLFAASFQATSRKHFLGLSTSAHATTAAASSIDPMQRLLMLKTAHENEVCSPVAEIGSKIKYSCLPNHCVASALATAAMALESNQNSQQNRNSKLRFNSANSMQEYYVQPAPDAERQAPQPVTTSSMRHGLVLLGNTSSIYDQLHQFDDRSLIRNPPLITYTHMNAYETPAQVRLIQPQHKHIATAGAHQLESLSDLDEEPARYAGAYPDQPLHHYKAPIVSRELHHARPASADRHFLHPKAALQSDGRPSLPANLVYLRPSYQSFQADAGWKPVTGDTLTSNDEVEKNDAVDYPPAPSSHRQQADEPTQRRVTEKTPASYDIRGVLRPANSERITKPQEESSDDDESDGEISRSVRREAAAQPNNLPRLTDIRTGANHSKAFRQAKFRRNGNTGTTQSSSSLPLYGLRHSTPLPPPEKDPEDEEPEQDGLKSLDDDSAPNMMNVTDCNCDKPTTRPMVSPEFEAQADKLPNVSFPFERTKNQVDELKPSYRQEPTFQPMLKDRRQVAGIGKAYNLRNTTYKNLQSAKDNARFSSAKGAPQVPEENQSLNTDMSTTTASSVSTWNLNNVANHTDYGEPNSNFDGQEQKGIDKTRANNQIYSVNKSSDNEMPYPGEHEEASDRLAGLRRPVGSSQASIHQEFKPSSVNDILAEARRDKHRAVQDTSNLSSHGSSMNLAETVPLTSNSSLVESKESEEADDEQEVVPHQYQIQLRHSNTSSSLELAPEVEESKPSGREPQDLAVERLKESERDRLFEHREEEHWHEKKWLKGRKRRRLVNGKWLIEPMPIGDSFNFGESSVASTKTPDDLAQVKKHFSIPTPNFQHSSKFLDWVQRDVNMNDEPRAPLSYLSSTVV